MKRFVRGGLFLVVMVFCGAGNAQSVLNYSFGQEDPQYTQFFLNPTAFNPGATGMEDAWVNTLDIRSQWVNIPGSPLTQAFSSQVPLYKASGGIGVTLSNDMAGQQRISAGALAYSWHRNLFGGILGLGVAGGIVQRSLDGSRLVTPTGDYEGIVFHNDPDLPVTLQTYLLPDASAGIYYFGRRLAAGVSAAHVLDPFLQKPDVAGYTIQYNPNGYVYLAYRFSLTDHIDLTPNVLYKTDLTQNIVDLNLLATFRDNFFAGASFRGYLNRSFDAVALIAGIRVNDRLRITYSYDITSSSLNTVSAGSHEVVIGYRIPVQKPRAGKMINNLRYLYY